MIASDDDYQASLNGISFASVADLDNFSTGNEDTYDVSSLLRSGENTLSVTVRNIATGDTDPRMNGAGLRYRLSMTSDTCAN